MHHIQLTNGRHFSASSNESILEAAIRAGLTIPYSCRTGRCSSCKCRVDKGNVSARQDQLGLTEAEIKDGWILSCINVPQTDLVLELNHILEFELPPSRTYPCKIDDLNLLTDDVIEVTLRLPPSVEFHYLPGQYVDLIGPNSEKRSYSLTQAQFEDSRLKLHVKKVASGYMSNYLFNDARQGDLLRINGPLGTFVLGDIERKDLIFLATGTGIAPVKAMLESIASLDKAARPSTIALFWGNREKRNQYFDLSKIIEALDIRYIPVLSRPDSQWNGAKGYVQDVFFAEKPQMANAKIYACGSSNMIKDAKQIASKNGLPDFRFHADAFVSSS